MIVGVFHVPVCVLLGVQSLLCGIKRQTQLTHLMDAFCHSDGISD
jgi:hypothetical protein